MVGGVLILDTPDSGVWIEASRPPSGGRKPHAGGKSGEGENDMLKSIPLWVVCDQTVHGPFGSVAECYDTEKNLRTTDFERARDTRMVHAETAAKALEIEHGWYPRVD